MAGMLRMMRGTYGGALIRSSRLLWCATLLLVFPGCGVASQGQSGELIRVTFIDVGQADAILIRSPEGQIALVDAGQGKIAVLVTDDDEETLDVPLNVLPHGLREGTVLRVTESEGHPLWASAMLDEDLRLRRLRQTETALNELKSRDPGGDIVL